jgi:hypothetical protein
MSTTAAIFLAKPATVAGTLTVEQRLPSFSRRKLLEHIPCRPAFDGSGLGVAVQVSEPCAADPVCFSEECENERLDSEKMRTNPFRSYGPLELGECQEKLLRLAQALPQRIAPEPYPQNQKELKKFPATEYRFKGHYKAGHFKKLTDGRVLYKRGKITVTGGHPEFSGKTLVEAKTTWGYKSRHAFPIFTAETGDKPDLGAVRSYINRTRTAVKHDRIRNATGKVLCACCVRDEIGEEEFVLCDTCSSKNLANGFSSGFRGYNEPLQDDSYLEAVAPDKYLSLEEPYHEEERPLYEHELALILAVKCKGFTKRNTVAHRKARRLAALLVGHFRFGHSFADLSHIVPLTSEKSAEVFCKRARADWHNYLRSASLEADKEAREALRLGLLRSIYPMHLTEGRRVYSQVLAQPVPAEIEKTIREDLRLRGIADPFEWLVEYDRLLAKEKCSF